MKRQKAYCYHCGKSNYVRAISHDCVVVFDVEEITSTDHVRVKLDKPRVDEREPYNRTYVCANCDEVLIQGTATEFYMYVLGWNKIDDNTVIEIRGRMVFKDGAFHYDYAAQKKTTPGNADNVCTINGRPIKITCEGNKYYYRYIVDKNEEQQERASN